jgi:tRNA(Ile)-lysidine synthase
MTLARRVLDTIRRHALMRRGDRVLVALSGGPDSVALLRLLGELEAAGELSVAGIAHLNHGLRDAATDDEQFCRALAAELGLEFRCDLVDVRARAARLRTSLEDAGRRARYELFERVANELGADVIATGHTRDDQAETFLLRLLRGAGPRGLAGIHPKTRLPAEAPEARHLGLPAEAPMARHLGLPAEAPEARRWSLPPEAPEARRWVVRPLLDVGRDELRAYLAALGQPFREDESNRDLSIPRNRVRHELLPLLARDFSPAVTDVLAREAEIARQDEDRLQHEAIDLLGLIVLRSEKSNSGEVDAVEVDVRALSALHPALAVRVVRMVLEQVAPGRFVGFDHVERLLELARDSRGHGALSLPGQHAERRGETLVLGRRPDPPEPFSNSFRVSLSIPGEVVLTPQGWAISATAGDTQPGQSPGTPNRDSPRGHPSGTLKVECPQLEQVVAADGLALPLAVRSRQPGDRVRPLGMGGREKKLQDVLVDRKVAREERDSLPLVVDSADKIVWVVGEPVTEDFRVTEASQAVIFLKARRLGGQG